MRPDGRIWVRRVELPPNPEAKTGSQARAVTKGGNGQRGSWETGQRMPSWGCSGDAGEFFASVLPSGRLQMVVAQSALCLAKGVLYRNHELGSATAADQVVRFLLQQMLLFSPLIVQTTNTLDTLQPQPAFHGRCWLSGSGCACTAL